jgi:hypothetical protein
MTQNSDNCPATNAADLKAAMASLWDSQEPRKDKALFVES